MPQTKKPKRLVRLQRALQDGRGDIISGWAKKQAARRQGRRKKAVQSGKYA